MTAPGPARLALAWAPAGAMMLLIWVLSSLPFPQLPLAPFALRDKVLHALEYSVLGSLVAMGASATWIDRASRRVGAAALLITTAWGLLDELHQAYVPGRSAEVADVAADAFGGLVGVLGFHVVARVRTRARCRRRGAPSRPGEGAL